jgi:flavodoxin
MTSLVVYSSETGNTKRVAEAIAAALPRPVEIFPVQEAPEPDGCDFIAIGFWVDRGGPDAKAEAYMKRIRGKRVGLFGTLGAYPDSEHAEASMNAAKAMVEGNEVICTFMCQGKIDPNLVRHMEEMTRENPDFVHAMTPERAARIEEAKKHPDDQDLLNAQRIFGEAAASLIAEQTNQRG